MKKLLSLLLIAAMAVSCINVDVEEDQAKATDAKKKKNETTGVFIHITHGSDDAHRALMGLSMAVKMAEDKDVAVYLDIDAIELVVKDEEPVTLGDHFEPSDQLLARLLESGVTVMACPGCMKVKGISEDMLLEGVIVANKNKFFNFTKGRILTIDY